MTPSRPAPTTICTLDELERDPALQARVQNGAVSIGNFDGVHSGHRQLLARVRAAADRVGGPAIVVVLDPHPAAVLRPHSAPVRLTTIARRAELMSERQIDVLVVCPATLEFLNRTADEFFQFLIHDRLQAAAMVEGPNFFFGRDRGGDLHRLQTLCEQSGKTLEIVDAQLDQQRMVSSSRIREAIAAGQIASANAMLDSVYQCCGRVTSGAGRGRTLGFPTANLTEIETLVPEHGVYAARVSGAFLNAMDHDRPTGKSTAGATSGSTDGSSPAWIAAAVHVGPNPTFDDEQRTKVEVHCLDYHGDLYGQILTVAWVDRVRGVQKFDGPESLTAQLHQDIESVRRLIT